MGLTNNTFSLKRVKLLLKKDIQELWKKYLIQSLAIYGILTFVFCADVSINKNNDINRLSTYSLVLFTTFGAIFASGMMEFMNSRAKRLSSIMLPSSRFEKFISRWLIVTAGYLIVFLLIFFLANATQILVCKILYPDINLSFINFDRIFSNRTLTIDKGYMPFAVWLINYSKPLSIISIYFLIQSIFILGSTFWEKNSFMKTSSVITVFIILYLLVCSALLNITGLENVHILEGDNNEYKLIIVFIICTIFSLVNWTISFYRFSESEIIKRW